MDFDFDGDPLFEDDRDYSYDEYPDEEEEYDHDEPHYSIYDDLDAAYIPFADPGGRSALRAGRRIHPCPTCGAPNRLTDADVALHYQCDACAERAEGLTPNAYY